MAYNDFEISEQNINKLPTSKDVERHTLCALIQANIQDEADATRKYFQLLEYLTDPDDIAQIKEIIADELNHAHELKKMVQKHSGIKMAID